MHGCRATGKLGHGARASGAARIVLLEKCSGRGGRRGRDVGWQMFVVDGRWWQVHARGRWDVGEALTEHLARR
eukprot:6247069-Prorocentrum_lima.AAC.1